MFREGEDFWEEGSHIVFDGCGCGFGGRCDYDCSLSRESDLVGEGFLLSTLNEILSEEGMEVGEAGNEMSEVSSFVFKKYNEIFYIIHDGFAPSSFSSTKSPFLLLLEKTKKQNR